MTRTAAEGLRNCFFSLNTNKIRMASSTERFANLGEAENQKLLEDKDSLNTKRSTKASRIVRTLSFLILFLINVGEQMDDRLF